MYHQVQGTGTVPVVFNIETDVLALFSQQKMKAFMTVGITSFLRFRIRYRVFYVVHHLVFAAYILTIMHTIDVVQRKNGGRSQAFKWFSASLLLYASDRAAMYLNNRYHTNIVSTNAVGGENEEKMVIVKAKRPELFFFHPGQYVYIKVPHLDNLWHPFSIGSAPESDTLDFYIKVFDEKSWSGRLFLSIQEMKKEFRESYDSWDDNTKQDERHKIEILGPYGVGLGVKMKYSRALIIGSGTGFVPCLSFLREHINQCMTIDAKGRDKDTAKNMGIIRQLTAQRSMHRVASIGDMSMNMHNGMDGSVHQQMSEMMKIIANANMAKRQIYGNALALLGPMLGLLMLGLTLSWNQLPFDPNQTMETFLLVGTITFQGSFLLFSSLKFWMGEGGSRDLWVYVDFIVVAISAIGDWYWSWMDMWGGQFLAAQLAYYTLLTSYMIFRYIVHVVGASGNTVEEMNKRKKSLVVFDKVKFVWVSRSALSIMQVYPEISQSWDKFVNAWGLDRASESCEILIHCTDRNKEACKALLNTVQSTNLYNEGAVRFGRPSIETLLDKNTEESLEHSAANDDVATSTLLAFCGSDRLGKVVKEAKIFNDIFLSMTGKTQHVVELFIQTYGGLVSADKEESTTTPDDIDDWNKTVHPVHLSPPRTRNVGFSDRKQMEMSEKNAFSRIDQLNIENRDKDSNLDSNASSKKRTSSDTDSATIDNIADIDIGRNLASPPGTSTVDMERKSGIFSFLSPSNT